MISKLRYFLCFVLIFASFLTTSAHSAPKTILVLGDSLSAEYGIPQGTGWVRLLEKRLEASKKEVRVVNASISGDTTSGGKARIPMLLEKHKPAVVIIELGGNDGLRGLSITSIEANLRAIISAAKKSKSRVLLLGMQMPPNYGASYTKNFATLYARLANETGSARVPFFLQGIADDPGMFQADRIHPTQAAQPVLLNNVWDHLLPLLN